MWFRLRHLFTPHDSNNNRARILQPAGLSVLIGLFILSQSGIQLLKWTPVLPEGWVLGYASNITASQVVSLTNTERAKLGLPQLAFSSQLSEAAAGKAAHMFANNYWAHIAPDGTTPWNFITGAGYRYAVAGENLARDFDTTEPMVQAWMGSPTHKENIVNAKYSEIGVAVVDGKLDGVETTLVVQMFGAPAQTQIAQASVITDTAAAAEEPAPVAPSATPVPIVTPTVEPNTIAYLDVVEEAEVETVADANDREEVAEVFDYDPALGVTLTSRNDSMFNRTYLSPLVLSKAIATSMVVMVVAVLLYDSVIIHKRKIPRFVGKNWAHLTFFGLVMIIILGLAQGKVL